MLYYKADFDRNGGRNSYGIRIEDMIPGAEVTVFIECSDGDKITVKGTLTKFPWSPHSILYTQIRVTEQLTHKDTWFFTKGELMAVYPDHITNLRGKK